MSDDLLAELEQTKHSSYKALVRCLLAKSPDNAWRPFWIRFDLTLVEHQFALETEDFGEAILVVERPTVGQLCERLAKAIEGGDLDCGQFVLSQHGLDKDWGQEVRSSQYAEENGLGDRACHLFSVALEKTPPVPRGLLAGERTGRTYKNFDRLFQAVTEAPEVNSFSSFQAGTAQLLVQRDEGRIKAVLRPKYLAWSVEPPGDERLRLNGILEKREGGDREIGPFMSPTAAFVPLGGFEADGAIVELRSIETGVLVDEARVRCETPVAGFPPLPAGTFDLRPVQKALIASFVPVGNAMGERGRGALHALAVKQLRRSIPPAEFDEALASLVETGALKEVRDPGPKGAPTMPDLGIPLNAPVWESDDPMPGERCFVATELGRKVAVVCWARGSPQYEFWRLGHDRIEEQVLVAASTFSSLASLSAACVSAHPAEVQAAIFELQEEGLLNVQRGRVRLTAAGSGKTFGLQEELAVLALQQLETNREERELEQGVASDDDRMSPSREGLRVSPQDKEARTVTSQMSTHSVEERVLAVEETAGGTGEHRGESGPEHGVFASTPARAAGAGAAVGALFGLAAWVGAQLDWNHGLAALLAGSALGVTIAVLLLARMQTVDARARRLGGMVLLTASVSSLAIQAVEVAAAVEVNGRKVLSVDVSGGQEPVVEMSRMVVAIVAIIYGTRLLRPAAVATDGGVLSTRRQREDDTPPLSQQTLAMSIVGLGMVCVVAIVGLLVISGQARTSSPTASEPTTGSGARRMGESPSQSPSPSAPSTVSSLPQRSLGSPSAAVVPQPARASRAQSARVKYSCKYEFKAGAASLSGWKKASQKVEASSREGAKEQCSIFCEASQMRRGCEL